MEISVVSAFIDKGLEFPAVLAGVASVVGGKV